MVRTTQGIDKGNRGKSATLGVEKVQSQMGRFHKRSFLPRLRNVLQRIPLKPVDINCLYFLEYAGIPPSEAAFNRGRCEVREATPEDLERVLQCQTPREALWKRVQLKDRCVVAIAGGRIVGFEWFCDKPFHLEERYAYKIAIPSDAIYAYDAFIVPEHRVSGVWLKFKTIYLRSLMQSRGRQRIITTIDHGNQISMNTHLRFGFRLSFKVLVFRLFGRSFFLERKVGREELTSPLSPSITRTQEPGEVPESWFSGPPHTGRGWRGELG